jgi:hypothetical protein
LRIMAVQNTTLARLPAISGPESSSFMVFSQDLPGNDFRIGVFGENRGTQMGHYLGYK